MKYVKVDLLLLFKIPAVFYLGYSGLVSWWVIGLLILMQTQLTLKLHYK
jgi:hypothetical protein